MLVLAVLPEPATARACLDHAALARAVPGGARLLVLHPLVEPRHLIAATEEVAIQELREETEGTAAARAAAVRAAFDAWAAASPDNATAEWREAEGTVSEVLADVSPDADLIVLPHPQNLDGQDALHEVVFRAGRPLLLAPDAPAPTALATLAVAWEPGEPARKALDGALPWLRRASRVKVMVAGAGGDVPDPSGALDRLSAAGVEAEVLRVAVPDGDVGAALLDGCRHAGADALVMGAYDRWALTEWLFGGATRSVLREATLPVFLHG